jgi:hypothetical protein
VGGGVVCTQWAPPTGHPSCPRPARTAGGWMGWADADWVAQRQDGGTRCRLGGPAPGRGDPTPPLSDLLGLLPFRT